MQMVKKIMMISALLWVALVLFMPKSEFYYALEKRLAQKDIRINEKSIDETLFSLTLKDVTLYVKGIKVAKIQEIRFFTLLFYSHLTLESLKVDASLSATIPDHTNRISMQYYLFAPTRLMLDANGSFGEAEGSIYILSKRVHLRLNHLQEAAMFKPFIKKDEKGWVYERAF